MATALTMDNKVKQVVSNIRNLPTPPIVFHQIQKVINDPKVSAVQIASILAEDPAMSVKVLKLTNSAFYGLTREVESVKQAVVIVGLEAVKNLVLSASVLDMFKGKDFDQEFQERFWRHSLATAFCSRLLAKRVQRRGIVDSDTAFSAGLLHDIGKIVVCCFLAPEHRKLMQARSDNPPMPSWELEDKVLGYNHAQVGSLLAAQWKLPHKLIDSINYHHLPLSSDCEEPIPYIIYLANYIAKKTFYDRDEAYLVGALDPGVVEYMGITNDDLTTFGELLREEYLKAETFMQMAGIH